MYLCCDMVGKDYSLQMIAKYLGRNDHTTVIHGRNKIAKELSTDENLQYTVNILKNKLNPG